MSAATYPIRPVSADELSVFFEAVARAFGSDMKPEDLEHEKLTAEPKRTLAAYDGDEIVGTASAFTFDTVIPGGRAAAGGVTCVGVAATHRRRGILSALMERQLADIHALGEPLAVLWASEASIYGRFGYGLATRKLNVEVDRVVARLRADAPVDDEIRLSLLPVKEAGAALRAIEDGLTDRRPGEFTLSDGWLASLVADPESRRNGFSSLRCVVATRDGDPVGYVLYRTKESMLRPAMLPDGDVVVTAQRALTSAAHAALVRHLLGVDLMRRVRWWNLPTDSVLPHLLANPRLAQTTVTDSVFVRIMDVAVALAARRYAAPVDVVVEIDDDRCSWNAGRWHLTADRNTASCERTTADPALRIGVEALGAAYLGGTSLTTLAAAGRVHELRAGSLDSVSIAFGWPCEPWCALVF